MLSAFEKLKINDQLAVFKGKTAHKTVKKRDVVSWLGFEYFKLFSPS
jgi:hypothetical protein